jgi:hypothetical protein
MTQSLKGRHVSTSSSLSRWPDHDSGGWVALILTLAIAGISALVLGIAVMAAQANHTDKDGFFASSPRQLTTPTHGFVSADLDVGGADAGWLLRKGRLGTVRITATGTESRPVFIGIARDDRVTQYLGGVAYDEVTDLDVDPLAVTTTRRAGTRAPLAPTSRTFWRRSTTGSGRQTLAWPVERGKWDIVVMNADGSRMLRTDVSVGASVPIVRRLGIGLLTFGAALSLVFVSLVLIARPRRNHAALDVDVTTPAYAGEGSR